MVAPSQLFLPTVRTSTGDFRAEKDRVLEEMRLRLKVLQEEKVLSPSQTELVISIGVEHSRIYGTRIDGGGGTRPCRRAEKS